MPHTPTHPEPRSLQVGYEGVHIEKGCGLVYVGARPDLWTHVLESLTRMCHTGSLTERERGVKILYM